MSNFDFLSDEWGSLFQTAAKAESWINTEPKASAHTSRMALEECVHLMYDMEYLELPYNTSLYNLIHESEFQSILPTRYFSGLEIIRKTGNNGAHYGRRVTPGDAEKSVRYLFDFVKWFANRYSDVLPELPDHFDESLIPAVENTQQKVQDLKAQLEKEQEALKAQIKAQQAALEAAQEKARESELALANYEAKAAAAKAKIQRQQRKRPAPRTREYTEAETRKHLIDVALKEAGWDLLRNGQELEFPVKGMPITNNNPKGNGFVDYVLWDDDGKPLALVEAKRTSKDVEAGRHQAFLYANCLEEMYGQRPVIFYTNGYETKIWDDTFYSAPRQVYGFYTKEELRWKIQQRTSRKNIRAAKVNTEIAGRPYQIEAIQQVAEALVVETKEGLRGNKRNALLVMATGSGKTRTAAAIVDMLTTNQWARRVLFLADRNALVRQAKKDFNEHLKNLSSVNLTEDKENDTTRLVFSTYPTMINQIDKGQKEGELFYGVGHFDLIIVDEAHRSVYNRYQAIFDYFDALILGLTATPKDSIDHNTYELFGCSDQDPTSNYSLEEAVPTYLKSFHNRNIATKFIREGIKYDELSEADKIKFEETFGDQVTGLFPEEIPSNAMNKWLFNKDTVDIVLKKLMQDGLKIQGGDELGRTIIFAVNQKHADFIVECFSELFPEKPAGYIAVIHNKVSHAQSLIEAFCDQRKENIPQIAVSVDMMDTGINAPRVLNLVFFKVVRSYAKFWQMIGRGTRLCPDVFGPGEDKEYFIIFDVCQNFEFFNVHKRGKESKSFKPLSQKIFEARVQVSRLLAQTGDPENLEMSKDLLDHLHQSVASLNQDHFQVKMNLRYVDKFSKRENWNNLSDGDIHDINNGLSALPPPEGVKESARRFDLLMLKMQIADLMELNSRANIEDKLMLTADALSKKYSVPPVAAARPLIEEMKQSDFYETLSQKRMEEIRLEIRDLLQYLDSEGIQPIYSLLRDEAIVSEESPTVESGTTSTIYKSRVEKFIRDNKNQITIYKLTKNQPITVGELNQLEVLLFNGNKTGTKEDFVKAYGAQPLGSFIRSIIGLDLTAANKAFATFIQTGNLNADQMHFIDNIIQFLTKNGTIDPERLFESPFTNRHDQGLVGVFDDAQAGKIIQIIKEVNGNAGVG